MEALKFASHTEEKIQHFRESCRLHTKNFKGFQCDIGFSGA